MPFERLRIWNLRNHTSSEFRPAPATTVVTGDNGSGKTSLLEACGLFSTLSSPRAGATRVLVRDGEPEGGAHLDPTTGVPLEIRIKGGRMLLRAGGSGVAAKDFLGRFRAVLFIPEDLDLVRGEPGLRRRALDDLASQLRPGYAAVRSDFERALRQRNAALRHGRQHQAVVYDEPLAQAAAAVIEARRRLTSELRPAACEVYARLAGRGELSMELTGNVGDEGRVGADLVAHLLDRHRSEIGRDLERGVTRTGPHRDDLELTVDGMPARTHASRGEQRSVALALRLAELRLVPEATLLLDDVLSELDPDRRRRVLELARGAQTVVTATEREIVPPDVAVDSVWSVKDGDLVEG